MIIENDNENKLLDHRRKHQGQQYQHNHHRDNTLIHWEHFDQVHRSIRCYVNFFHDKNN